MTTPVDPRPYAAPTDLVTAADVARWLREQIYEWDADCDTANPRQVVTCVAIALERRLDRERRQACRRGALVNWREARRLAASPQPETIYWPDVAVYLTRALAFRAAARAR